jgi:hypothetical protein
MKCIILQVRPRTISWKKNYNEKYRNNSCTFLFISLSMSSRPALCAPRDSSCLCWQIKVSFAKLKKTVLLHVLPAIKTNVDYQALFQGSNNGIFIPIQGHDRPGNTWKCRLYLQQTTGTCNLDIIRIKWWSQKRVTVHWVANKDK